MWEATVFALLVGFVSAGFVGSLWASFAGQMPGPATLGVRDFLLPIRVLAVVFHAPFRILKLGSDLAAKGHAIGILAILGSAGWCFLQGVFILTVIFRLS